MTPKRCDQRPCTHSVEISVLVGFPRRRREFCAQCAFKLGEQVGLIEPGSARRIAFPATPQVVYS